MTIKSSLEPVPFSEPNIFQDNKVQANLEAYCKDYCNISVDQMNIYIAEGKKLEKLLSHPNTTPEQLAAKASPESAVAFMWLLMAKAAQYDKLFVSGSIRLADGEKARDFLKACGQQQVYGRISTHMKENIGKKLKVEGKRHLRADNPQMGFDLRDQGLPAGKNTILFALQPDGSLFIKMEESGCPPFWQNGFRSMTNFIEYIYHCIDFIITRFIDITKSNLATRKEHVPVEIDKAFKKTMEALFPPEKQSFFRKQTLSPEGNKFYNLGKKYGISRMQMITIEALKKDLNSQQHTLASAMVERLKAHNLIPEKYQGDVKGEEVLIPALGN